MAVNFDSAVSSVRSVLRGEAAGSVKFLAAGLLALTVWTGVVTVNNWTAQSVSTLTAQQGRFRTLLVLGDEYKTLAPTSRSSSGNVDVAAVFAQVSEQMQLGSRVNRISPDGRNQSVEINRLYAEEFAELRALPAGNERLFTVSAIIGPVN